MFWNESGPKFNLNLAQLKRMSDLDSLVLGPTDAELLAIEDGEEITAASDEDLAHLTLETGDLVMIAHLTI